jgi:hypothetical protein
MPVRRGVPWPPRHFLDGRAAQISKRFTTISGGPWPGAGEHGAGEHGAGGHGMAEHGAGGQLRRCPPARTVRRGATGRRPGGKRP